MTLSVPAPQFGCISFDDPAVMGSGWASNRIPSRFGSIRDLDRNVLWIGNQKDNIRTTDGLMINSEGYLPLCRADILREWGYPVEAEPVLQNAVLAEFYGRIIKTAFRLASRTSSVTIRDIATAASLTEALAVCLPDYSRGQWDGVGKHRRFQAEANGEIVVHAWVPRTTYALSVLSRRRTWSDEVAGDGRAFELKQFLTGQTAASWSAGVVAQAIWKGLDDCDGLEHATVLRTTMELADAGFFVVSSAGGRFEMQTSHEHMKRFVGTMLRHGLIPELPMDADPYAESDCYEWNGAENLQSFAHLAMDRANWAFMYNLDKLGLLYGSRYIH